VAEHRIPDPAGFGVCLRTASPDDTRVLATRAAALLRGGEVLLLHGPLGAGKTCFVQGLCAALGVTGDVTSPTFTLANRYEGRLVVHHLDFYRVGPQADLADIGVDALLDEVEAGQAVLVAEWPERLARLVRRRLEFLVLPAEAPDERIWHLRGVPELPLPWAALAADAGGDAC
jgi:tRNA threonylcarbamoyladenosine biosynthesis protein TsaE